MKFLQALKMAFSAMASTKMRSFLTMLGIIIGVLSVMLLVAVGQGTSAQVTDQISSLGTNLITVNLRAARSVRLTLKEIEALKGKGSIAEAAPLISSNLTLKAGINSHDTTVQGTTPGYSVIRGEAVSAGRLLVQSDIDNRNAVCVVGVDVADELFGQRSVVGETIRIDGRAFTVVGVFEEKGSSMGQSEDDRVMIPFTTAQRAFRNTQISTFYASADSEETVDLAVASLEAFMLKKTGSADEYRVFSQTQLLDTISEVTGMLSLMLAGISGISLLVGGIGIMNIMLVSVTERTREIGIRKAIGARRLDIMTQFMIEAIVLSLSGGLIGVGLGYMVERFVAPAVGLAMSISEILTALALGFSMAIGVLFGSYPAWKAARLLPIDALRYE